MSLGTGYRFGVAGSRGENCLFMAEWDPEVPQEGDVAALPHSKRPGKGRGQGQGHSFASICRRGRESSLHIPLRGTDSQPMAGRDAALPSSRTGFTSSNYPSPW